MTSDQASHNFNDLILFIQDIFFFYKTISPAPHTNHTSENAGSSSSSVIGMRDSEKYTL